MASIVNKKPVDDIYASLEQKNKPQYLKGMMDYWIGKLFYEKRHIPICRRYYSGRRDTEEFQYLNDNYGIGNPIDIQFTPIIKPRIDALVGLYLDESFSYRISITDKPTLDLEKEAKKNYTLNVISQKLQEKANKYKQFYTNKADGVSAVPPSEALTREFLTELGDYLDKDFTTVYGEAAQHLIQYFEQDGDLDFRRKFAELLYDLLITGEMFWRNHIEEDGKDPVFEVVKPENLFFNKNKNDLYMGTADAVVHREYMTRHQILQKHGHKMTDEDRNRLFGKSGKMGGNARRIYDPERMEEHLYAEDPELNHQFTGTEFDTVPVYHVEWLASSNVSEPTSQDRNPVERKDGITKKSYIEHRYEGIRIGDIYIAMGRSKNVIRSQRDPYKANLSYNGLSYNVRQGEPYSMVWNLKDVQDMYDITQFHRNNLIATSGVSGTRVNMAGIPKVLGNEFMERLMKWVALRKQGIELIDPTEEGAQLFNHYGEFQGGIDGNAINGINAILQTLERQVVLTTGVTDQMLGQIAEREAVENVKVGIRQVSLITLNIFDLLDGARKRALTELINLSKVSFKKGKQGSYKIGQRSVAFKIAPDHFKWTDYNIQVTNSSRDALKLQKLEALVNELVGAGIIKPETAVELVLANTIFEAREIIRKGMGGKDGNAQKMQQMDQQVKQYEEQLKEAGQQAAKLQQERDRYQTEQFRLDKDKFEFEKKYKMRDLDIKDNKQQAEENFKEQEVKARREIVQLEREQLYVEGANEQAREINNSKF